MNTTFYEVKRENNRVDTGKIWCFTDNCFNRKEKRIE